MKCCFSRTRIDFAGGYVVDVHYANDVVFAIAAALHVCVELIFETLVDVISEERWVDVDFPFKIP